MLRITAPSVVKSYADDFEDFCSKPRPVTEECCDSQITAWRKLSGIRQGRRLEKRPSRSMSLPHGASEDSQASAPIGHRRGVSGEVLQRCEV